MSNCNCELCKSESMNQEIQLIMDNDGADEDLAIAEFNRRENEDRLSFEHDKYEERSQWLNEDRWY